MTQPITATAEQIVEALNKAAQKIPVMDRPVWDKLIPHFLEALQSLPTLDERIDKLQKFKEYVHKRLDDAGVEKEPNGEHSKHGCRIGDRLDLVLKPLGEREVLTKSEAEGMMAVYNSIVDENKKLKDDIRFWVKSWNRLSSLYNDINDTYLNSKQG